MLEYLKERYGLVRLSGRVFNKLNEAYNSSVHVSPLYLKDLFVAMEQNLNSIRANNIAKGKKMEGEDLLLYDLAVILSYYPKYMRKMALYEKQSNELKDLEQFIELAKNVKPNKTKQEEFTDVSDIVNDLFFS